MRNRFSSFFILLLIIIIGVLAYFLGKKSASKTVDSIIMNNVIIKQIAELSSLEVHGNASIKSTNLTNDGSITDGFKKLFLERTLNVSVPYVAKYGIDLGKQNINIEEKSKQVYVVLPIPKLISYELLLDRSDIASQKGLLESGDEANYNKVMQELYMQSKKKLENNEGYKQQSKQKIKKIIEDYYAPLEYKVDITFSDDLRSKVLQDTLQ